MFASNLRLVCGRGFAAALMGPLPSAAAQSYCTAPELVSPGQNARPLSFYRCLFLCNYAAPLPHPTFLSSAPFSSSSQGTRVGRGKPQGGSRGQQ